ncbi:MAG: hypothetical protein ACO363_07410, partial [Balneolaceae bacterium]
IACPSLSLHHPVSCHFLLPHLVPKHLQHSAFNMHKKKDLRAGGLSSASSEARYRIRGVCLRD